MEQQKNSKTGNTQTRESTAKKKAAFLKVLDGSLGNISQACTAVSISRTTYYRWIESDAKFKAKADEIAESAIDYVESKLMETIKEKNPTSIIFFLKTRAKNRGYVERQELTGSDGGAIMPKIEIEIIDKAEDVDIKPYEDTDD